MSRLLHLLLALASFAGISAIQRAPLPWPGGSGVADKWLYFEQHADEYDVVMIGSSRLYRSFAPREMRATWAESGRKLSVFNLAAPGLGRFEADFLAAKVLAMEPKRLKTLIVELWRWDPNEMKRNELTPRAVYWHSAEQTYGALWSTYRYPELTTKKRWRLAFAHIQHFGLRLSNYGLGPVLAETLTAEAEPGRFVHVRKNHGYRALEEEPFGSIRERRDLFLEERGEFEEAMLERHAEVRAGDPALQLNLHALGRRVRASREAGVEVIFVVPPGPWAPPSELRIDVDPVPPVLSYSDREQYPYLYREEGRFDRFHVTAAVAKKLSRQFARDLLPFLAKQ